MGGAPRRSRGGRQTVAVVLVAPRRPPDARGQRPERATGEPAGSTLDPEGCVGSVRIDQAALFGANRGGPRPGQRRHRDHRHAGPNLSVGDTRRPLIKLPRGHLWTVRRIQFVAGCVKPVIERSFTAGSCRAGSGPSNAFAKWLGTNFSLAQPMTTSRRRGLERLENGTSDGVRRAGHPLVVRDPSVRSDSRWPGGRVC